MLKQNRNQSSWTSRKKLGRGSGALNARAMPLTKSVALPMQKEFSFCLFVFGLKGGEGTSAHAPVVARRAATSARGAQAAPSARLAL